MCGKHAAASEVPLPSARTIICASGLDALDDLAVDAGVITADQLAEAAALGDEPQPTTEESYRAALDDEVRWNALADGTLTRATDDLTRGRAWGRRHPAPVGAAVTSVRTCAPVADPYNDQRRRTGQRPHAGHAKSVSPAPLPASGHVEVGDPRDVIAVEVQVAGPRRR